MPTEPLITWPDPLIELIGFLAVFFAAGAIGFRLAVLPGLLGASAGEERDFGRGAARRAAVFGTIGILTSAAFFLQRLPGFAARRHMSVTALLTSQPPVALQAGLLAAAVLGFLLALAGRGSGWGIASLGVLLLPVRAAFLGHFDRLAKPLHEIAGGLWIGTLLILVVAGIAPALRSRMAAERRAALVARMVAGFSPLALVSAATLAVFGVIIAWQNLKRLDALWTTPYGYALIAKLCVVAGVVTFGAWNWKRQKPRLGTEAGGHAIRRSASMELALGGIVLLITSVLVSLPSPK